MCPERFSLVGLILRGSTADAERALPGKGCELIEAMAAVGDMGLIVGLVCGVALTVALHGAFGSVSRSRHYLSWKEARNVD